MEKKMFATGDKNGVQKVICKVCGTEMTKVEVKEIYRGESKIVRTFWIYKNCKGLELE